MYSFSKCHFRRFFSFITSRNPCWAKLFSLHFLIFSIFAVALFLIQLILLCSSWRVKANNIFLHHFNFLMQTQVIPCDSGKAFQFACARRKRKCAVKRFILPSQNLNDRSKVSIRSSQLNFYPSPSVAEGILFAIYFSHMHIELQLLARPWQWTRSMRRLFN